MEKINAVITGVGGYVPDYVLTNEELSRMVDTNDEWIMTRIGVKERRILNEEGLGTSYMARKAAKQLMQKTNSDPDSIDCVIVATTTPDYHFPSTASILCDKLGLKNAYAFDLQAACSGFLYAMETAASMIQSGRHKKIIIVGADKMSSMVNYSDRATCPIFGDGAAACMVEATTEDYGIMDSILRTDGKGLPFRLAGILTQQQAGRTGKAGQSQPDQRDKFQTGAGQPGDPAPAGREKLRQLAGQPVELDEQNQNRQHDKSGHYLQKVLQHRQPPMTREKIIRQGHMPHRLLQILSARKGCLASHPDAEPVSKASGIGAACCRPGTCCRCAADESPCRHRQQGEGVSFPTNKQ